MTNRFIVGLFGSFLCLLSFIGNWIIGYMAAPKWEETKKILESNGVKLKWYHWYSNWRYTTYKSEIKKFDPSMVMFKRKMDFWAIIIFFFWFIGSIIALWGFEVIKNFN